MIFLNGTAISLVGLVSSGQPAGQSQGHCERLREGGGQMQADSGAGPWTTLDDLGRPWKTLNESMPV